MIVLKLALVGCLLTVVLGQKTKCTTDAITAAQNAFNTFLGLDSSITWSNPVGLAFAVQNKFINGPGSSGLVAVCNAYNAYLKSMSDANVDYKTCIDPAFIIKNDNDPATGYGYAGILNMIAYQCGAGLYPALTKWSCIQNTYRTRNSTLLSCLTSLHLDSQNNVTAACSYTKTAILCWQQQFIQTCSNDNEISYYGCQTIRSYTAAAYGECNDRCLIFTSPSFAIDEEFEELQRHDQEAMKAPPADKVIYEIDEMLSSAFKVLALCALLGSIQGQGGMQPCDMNVFQPCANTLGQYLGTSYTLLFNDFFLFDSLYNKFISASNLADVVTMCNALTSFYSCVSPTFDQCLAPSGWVSQGKSPAQAYINDGVLRQYAFICGAGFPILNEPVSFSCIQTTYKNNYDALVNQTLRIYRTSIAYDPANACKYAATLQTSWAAVLSNTTCFQNKRREVASFFGCGAALQYTSAQFYHCIHQNTCAWTANWTNTMSYLKVENGVTYLRIPAHPDKDEFGELFQTEEKWIPLNI